MKKWISALSILLSFVGFSQNQFKIDSLEKVLNESSEDAHKVSIIIELSELYQTNTEGEIYAKSALDLAKKSKDSTLQIKALKNLSRWNYSVKKYDLSLSYLNNVSDILTFQNDSLGIGKNLYSIGNIYKKNGQLDLALDAYQKSINILEKFKDFKTLCEVLNKAGITHKDIENYPEAMKHYHRAYDIALKHKLDQNLASTCTNMGVVFKRQNNYLEALKYYQMSKKIHTSAKNYVGLANIYNNIGNIHRRLKQVDSALINFKTAIFYREKSGTEKMLSYSYNNIAISFSDIKMYDSALHYLKISEKFKLKNDSRSDLASTYLNYAEIYVELNDTINFNKYYSNGIAIAEDYNDKFVINSLITAKSTIQAQNNNYKDAYLNILKVIEQLNDDKIDQEQQQIATSVLNVQFNDKRKTQKINNLAEANDKLIDQNNEINLQKNNLKMKDQLSFYLILALIGCAIFLISMILILFQKNKKLANNASTIEKAMVDLNKSQGSIEEKETLIKEVHHRVKNNLQIIKSLVRLQKNNVQDSTTKSILSEFELRVSSMALVHESLYKSDDLSKVNINAYYEKLIYSLIEAYSVSQSIETNMNIDVVSLELDTLIPLGLLTNEIISNALKYGLKGQEKGLLTINFYLKNDFYYLYISDNGLGFPVDMEERVSNSLGMELIDALVQQLDGEMIRSSNPGAQYNIKFKKTNQ
ncbi:MAG: two-component sensor histidine kinase [Parvicella sp.]|jgi:two-component sensor histidine kinase